MARTVRKLKRGKPREYNLKQLPSIIITPPDLDMKFKVNNRVTNETTIVDATTNEASTSVQPTMDFNVNELIAQLSENSKASKGEIENIQRKLLHQANQILKVNAFANQPVPEPRVIASTQKYNRQTVCTTSGITNGIYGRPLSIANLKQVQNNNLETQMVSERRSSTIGNVNQCPNINEERQIVQNGRSLSIANVNNSSSHNKEVPTLLNGRSISIGNAKVSINVQEAQMIPERLQESVGVNMERTKHGVTPTGAGRSFFYETSFEARPPGSVHAATGPGTVSPVPPYRMPPAPEAALPGAPAPSAPTPLHTHSAKFPIEREVILSSGDKSSKVPILQDARKRGRLGAVAPDTPPKALSAWTHAENQQAGPSSDFRQYEQNYGYAMHQSQSPNPNQGAVARNIQNYDSPKPPVPAKNTYKPEQSSHITVTVETGKDNTRDAPKSNNSVSKTYNTLKDMISSRFKNKEGADSEKNEEARLNNNSVEERKRSEPEPVSPREMQRKEQGIYGRPMPQTRPEMQYSHGSGVANNIAYPSPSPHRQLMHQQQQIVQQQMMLNQQARSQEMLASPHRPQALGADALYQQYGPPGRRSAVYQRDLDVRSMANFTSLKTSPQQQFENSHSRLDLRSPQQLEREIVRQRGFVEGRRAASHPHLLDEPQPRLEIASPQIHDRSRRNSHGNLLDSMPNENGPPRSIEERESDDGGFRMRLAAQGRSSFEERIRTSGRSIESRQERGNEVYRRTPDSHRESRRTPDNHRESRRTPDNHRETRRTPENHGESRKTPDSLGRRHKELPSTSVDMERNDESASQKSADSVYNSSGKPETFVPQPSSSRQTPSRIEDLKAHGKKGASCSGTSSDYDKNGGQSSNVDSGRGSVAYSSGRRPDASLHDTSADSDAVGSRVQPQPGTSQQNPGPAGENEWADLVECELRQILEPKLSSMRLDSSASSDGSVTPPLPPLSPSSDLHKRNSLPGRSAEYPEERRRGRESPRWHAHTHAHKKHSSKRDHHYKKHLFGLDTTDMTSTTTRSLDLSSLLDGRTDSDASTGDARAIRRQLRGLENMYAEVLQLLGVRKPANLAKQPTWEARLSSKRRYGSMSSLPSSSVSSRPVRDKRRSSNEHRKKHDLKGINKRFQRLESHVVTLARSVAHLSSEMRTHHLVMQEMDNIRAEIAALRHMYKSQQYIRSGHPRHLDPYSFSNPERVKRLTKFFGDEPPLMRLFLKKLGYEKYAALLEKEKVGAAELPYVGEDKLRALGVPLGPRMRILKEAGLHQDLHHMSRDDHNTTTTTLAIV